jgi:hypothetical protein
VVSLRPSSETTTTFPRAIMLLVRVFEVPWSAVSTASFAPVLVKNVIVGFSDSILVLSSKK